MTTATDLYDVLGDIGLMKWLPPSQPCRMTHTANPSVIAEQNGNLNAQDDNDAVQSVYLSSPAAIHTDDTFISPATSPAALSQHGPKTTPQLASWQPNGRTTADSSATHTHKPESPP
eukprot:GHUV01025409.1.p1 GENE.GHUV01025409.1~~GHUV01025409.1.p1  ORF type:complete len:117 (-),score=35.74 GHUV01025409.1:334-684(-)